VAVLAVLYATMLWFWVGCTPTNRYKVLSFFFDGVPNPNAPAAGVAAGGAGAPAAGKTVRTVYYHKPYLDNNCQACHTSAGQTFSPLGMLDSRMCLKCHQSVTRQYPVMHGPVALGDCLWCHSPHESTYAHLLKAPDPQVCVQCHERDLLPSLPAVHQDPAAGCLQCHMGHGGNAHKFLRPAAATNPATSRQAAALARPIPAPARTGEAGL
jgi:predicted CXXCH cytochrome family protein